jgi:hypothetical protein
MGKRNGRKSKNPRSRQSSLAHIKSDTINEENQMEYCVEGYYDIASITSAIAELLDKMRRNTVDYDYIFDDIKYLIEDYLSNFMDNDKI